MSEPYVSDAVGPDLPLHEAVAALAIGVISLLLAGVLPALLGALKANPDWKVSIEGHTDSTGNAAHNLDLSQRRAASVKIALVAAGIAADRLTTAGFGQTKPVASNDSAIGRAQNRRVEVVRK